MGNCWAVLVGYDFESDASDSSGNGLDGILGSGASLGGGVLSLDGTDEGYLELPPGFAAVNPFGGSDSWTVQFDFASTEGGTGPLFSSESSSLGNPDGNGSLTIYLGVDGNVVADLWFLGTLHSNFGYDDNSFHTLEVSYDSPTSLLSLEVDGNVASSSLSWNRNTASDETRLGNTGNSDVVIDIGQASFHGRVDNFSIFDNNVPDPIAFALDIKPGSDSNPINLKSGGLPVAILGSEDFDVTLIDATTLVFGPDSAAPRHNLADSSVHADHLQDVNEDGYLDLVSHYQTRETGLTLGDTLAELNGSLINGIAILGSDSIAIIPRRNAVVPEPTTAVMAVFALLTVPCLRRLTGQGRKNRETTIVGKS